MYAWMQDPLPQPHQQPEYQAQAYAAAAAVPVPGWSDAAHPGPMTPRRCAAQHKSVSRSRSRQRSRRSTTPGCVSVATSSGQSARFLHDGQQWEYYGNVFDKMTDPALYTGSHRHRFDEFGNGRGAAGRELGARGQGCGFKKQSQASGGGTLAVSGAAWADGLRGNLYESRPEDPSATLLRQNASVHRSMARARSGSPSKAHLRRSVQRTRVAATDVLTPFQRDDFYHLGLIEKRLGIPYNPHLARPEDPDAEIEARWAYIRQMYPDGASAVAGSPLPQTPY